MKNSQEYSWTTPQRQSWSGLLIIIFKAGGTILKAFWPLLVVFLFRERRKVTDPFALLLIFIPAIILIRSLTDFFYFRFYIEADNLIIKKGFIKKKTITIPLGRIQAVHLEQNLLHRILNVTKVKIDTAGTEKTEAVIDAISIEKATQLKQFLLQQHSVGTNTEEYVETPIIRLSFADLFKLGISANHIQAFFITLAFAVSMFNNLEEILGDQVVMNVLRTSSEKINYTFNIILLLIVVIMIVSIMVSMIRIILAYYDFHLSETPQGFKVRSGLLNTKENLVPFSKIQYISWDANWFRRKIGLYNLEFHHAAGEKTRRKFKLTIPLTHPLYIEKLLSRYHHDIRSEARSVHRIHPAYPWRRLILLGTPVAVIAIVLLLIWPSSYHWIWFFWLPYILFSSMVFRKNFLLYISAEALEVHSGVWGRKLEVLQWYKIQHVSLKRSIYQRHHGLASIALYTAGGTIHIPYIDLELAERIQNYALYKVELGDKNWM
jgi:putative membrane protein